MPNINEIFGSKLLKASDLKGRDVPLTIASYSMVEFPNDPRPKLVLSFDGTEKEMVVNRTNGNWIAESHGEDTDQWIGKRIILFPDRVEFKGEIVDAIRVRPPEAGQAQAPRVDVLGREAAAIVDEVTEPGGLEDDDGSPPF